MKRIAIDINDVIRDYTFRFLEVYREKYNGTCKLNYEDITDFDLFKVFDFSDVYGYPSKEAYNQFKYQDYAYDIFCMATTTDPQLTGDLNLWTQKTMKNYPNDKVPELLLVSPFETGLSIPSTLAFLGRIGSRIREYYFPTDSMTIWDKCDILITANPNLIQNKPENKTVIKIKAPYNKNVKGDFEYDSFTSLIREDGNKTLNTLINE